MDDNFALVEFQGDEIVTMFDGRTIWVAIRQVCAAIGLHWPNQRRKILSDVVLASALATTTSPIKGKRGRTVTLPLQFMQGWLFKIDVAKIYDETVRERVIAWRKDGYGVIRDHWNEAGKTVDFAMSPQRYRNFGSRRLELSSLLDRLERERHPVKRRIIYAVLQRACKAEGIPPPGINEIVPSPDEDLARAEAFFQLLSDLRDRGVVIDHHRDPALLAVQLRDVEIAAHEHKLECPRGPQLWPGLRVHFAFHSSRVVNCRDGKSRYCWTFWRDKLTIKIPPPTNLP